MVLESDKFYLQKKHNKESNTKKIIMYIPHSFLTLKRKPPINLLRIYLFYALTI